MAAAHAGCDPTIRLEAAMRVHRNFLVVLMTTAACGASDPQPTSPAVSEARQETRSSTEAGAGDKAKGDHAMCDHGKDPAMAEASILLQGQRYDEAAEKLAAIAAAEPTTAKAVQLHGYALHAAGRLDEALVVHQRAAGFPETASVASYNIACVHALKGDKEAAFAALDKAIATGFHKPEYLEKDTDLESLRGDARFSALMDAAKAKAASMPAKAEKNSGGQCDHPHGASAVH
jgi:tetratricopeptide (TPR) repeat protein